MINKLVFDYVETDFVTYEIGFNDYEDSEGTKQKGSTLEIKLYAANKVHELAFEDTDTSELEQLFEFYMQLAAGKEEVYAELFTNEENSNNILIAQNYTTDRPMLYLCLLDSFNRDIKPLKVLTYKINFIKWFVEEFNTFLNTRYNQQQWANNFKTSDLRIDLKPQLDYFEKWMKEN